MIGVRLVTARCVALGATVLFVPSCGNTLDSLGCSERKLDGGTGADGGATLAPLIAPVSYPNAFRDMLGRSDSEIAAKLESTFTQLFHGEDDQTIFSMKGTDQAYIYDVLREKTRTEGIGLGMLIAVQLDKRQEFDQLWRYAKSIQVVDGPARGYFPSFCVFASGEGECFDPYGFQQIAMSLLLARGRWQDAPGSIDYGGEAAALIDVARNKETYNCGVVDDITATFDAVSYLPYSMPTKATAGVSRPSIVMPAYYDLWHRATRDDFWSKAASAARTYLQASAHPITGLIPEQAAFDGTPVAPFHNFKPECYRAFLNMTLDRLWSDNSSQEWMVQEGSHVLQFFSAKGLTTYGQMYSLDGKEEIESVHDVALVSANGTLALVATTKNRGDFVKEVWNLPTPTGKTRYYPGIIHMVSLLMLSGRMQVY